MEREQNSVDIKYESTLERVPESFHKMIKSVSPIFIALWAVDDLNPIQSERK